ncbi:MAG: hypothetical protein EBT37_07835 [Betaproteobacteria bacterium]|nr:hypothetical protein [Betaproteobacteria bacterium]
MRCGAGQSGDYWSLVLEGKDWLDKPHFPFWLGALSFKLLGISPLTYALPGYVFHVLGAYYTYRIARLFYGRGTALLALLVFVSTYHVMYSTTALKAEAFLTGSITGACYYWLRWDTAHTWRHLLLGAALSAMAVMTKGIFTLITISSGLVCLWAYQGRLGQLLRLRWLAALGLTLLFLAPEIYALYWQFDSHPEKVVFGQTGVSGIRFFLWDSQFGRFFNSGPIRNVEGNTWYFLHVFLWAFLPWVAAFGMALVHGLRGFGQRSAPDRAAFVYLCASFFVTFALFSATAFQLDYYTVIVYPFAAIVCAYFLHTRLQAGAGTRLVAAQWVMTLITLGLAWVICLQVGQAPLTVLLTLACVAWLAYGLARRKAGPTMALLVHPVLAVNLLYLVLEGMTLIAHTGHALSYRVLPVLAREPQVPVLVYDLDPTVAWDIGLARQSAPSQSVRTLQELPAAGQSYFLLARTDALPSLAPHIGQATPVLQGQWVDHKTGTLPRQIRLAAGKEAGEAYTLLRVQAP